MTNITKHTRTVTEVVVGAMRDSKQHDVMADIDCTAYDPEAVLTEIASIAHEWRALGPTIIEAWGDGWRIRATTRPHGRR